jgi:hypothetical protein
MIYPARDERLAEAVAGRAEAWSSSVGRSNRPVGFNFPNIPGTTAPHGWPVFVAVQAVLILLGGWYFGRCELL